MSRMRLGVDARPLSWPDARGKQRVTRNLLRELAERFEAEIELILYSNSPFLFIPPGVTTRTLPGTQFSYCIRGLPKAVKEDKCDVFLGTAPAVVVTGCPSAYMVYDGFQFKLKVALSSIFRRPLGSAANSILGVVAELVQVLSARFADGLIFDSQCVQQEFFSISPHSRHKPNVVAHLGVDPDLSSIDTKESRKRIERELGIDGRFLLYVGAVSWPKNIEGLVAMYRHLRKADSSLSLVVVGGSAWPKYYRDPLDGTQGIRYFPYLKDRDVAALYSTCEALVTMSFYEGFGLPVLEAMSHGAPVVVSDRGSLPEVAGNAGLVIDPSDPVGTAKTVERLVNDRSLWEKQRNLSLARANDFSWSHSADQVVSLLRRLVSPNFLQYSAIANSQSVYLSAMP